MKGEGEREGKKGRECRGKGREGEQTKGKGRRECENEEANKTVVTKILRWAGAFVER